MSAGLPNRNSIAGEPAAKACAACGTKFSCGASIGRCWCDGVKLSPETVAALCAQFSDCVCSACLAKAAESTQQGS